MVHSLRMFEIKRFVFRKSSGALMAVCCSNKGGLSEVMWCSDVGLLHEQMVIRKSSGALMAAYCNKKGGL